MRWTALILPVFFVACEGSSPLVTEPLPRVPYRDDAPSTVPLFTGSVAVSYGAPVVHELPDGTLLAYADRTRDVGVGPVTRHVVSRSIDEGASWSEPIETPRGLTIVDRERERLVSFEIPDSELTADIPAVAIGQLDGLSWEGRTVPQDSWAAGFRYHIVGTGSTQLASGRLVIALLGYMNDVGEAGIYLLLSDDGGDTYFVGGLQPLDGFQYARPSLEALPDGRLRVRAPGGLVFASHDDGETLTVEESAPPPPPSTPVFHWTTETEPALLAVDRVDEAVGISRSDDEGTTWGEPVLIHHGPGLQTPIVLTRSGLLVVAHGVQRTVAAPGGTSTETDWVVTRVGPGWLDAPVCDDECTSGARTCSTGQTVTCADGQEVCRGWSEPAPSCSLGSIACEDGVLRTCDEVSGCAGWTDSLCASAFCYDAERCGESVLTPLSLGPDGQVQSLAFDADGGAVAFGGVHDSEFDEASVDVVRLAADGSVAWSYTLPTTAIYGLQSGSVAIDADGRVWAATWGNVHRLATDGMSSDAIAIPTARITSPRALGLATGGDLLVTGFVIAALPGQVQTGSSDPFLARISAAGVLLWAVQFAGTVGGYNVGEAVGAHSMGDAYVTGVTGATAFLHRVDEVGDVVWSRTWTGTASALTVIGTDVVVAGGGHLRRYDQDGNLAWEEAIAITRVTSVDSVGGEIVVGGQDDAGAVRVVTADGSGNVTATQRMARYVGTVVVHPRGEAVVVAGSHGVARLAPAP